MRPSRDDITPFLDFLLLTLLALLAITAQRLDVETIQIQEPQVTGGVEAGVPLGEAMVLELDADGGLHLEGRPVAVDAVVAQLERESRTVLLRVDDATPSGVSLDCLSRLREAAEAVHLQTEKVARRAPAGAGGPR